MKFFARDYVLNCSIDFLFFFANTPCGTREYVVVSVVNIFHLTLVKTVFVSGILIRLSP